MGRNLGSFTVCEAKPLHVSAFSFQVLYHCAFDMWKVTQLGLDVSLNSVSSGRVRVLSQRDPSALLLCKTPMRHIGYLLNLINLINYNLIFKHG